jgi:DNA-binding XRE family transcriptional regulator
MKTMKYEDFRTERLKNPDVKREYDIIQREFELAKEVIELRRRSNLTQKELAKQIGTSQRQ